VSSVTRDLAVVARDLRLGGVVQGVGFRPHVWRRAREGGLAGWVRNQDGIVEIHVEGMQPRIDRFCRDILDGLPPLARVDRVEVAVAGVSGATEFVVEASIGARSPAERRLVAPDAVTCRACLDELRDPADRRYGYPFTNCTDCGPRFTIIEELPYDRSRTSMSGFDLCPECAAEYGDPADRRFHAEPVACPACGPTLTLRRVDGQLADGDPIGGAAAVLRSGGVLALKGLGGYQLACDARDEDAIAALRRRKRRPHKPLAVMAAGLDQVRSFARPSAAEEALLSSPAGPIVLLAARDGALAPSVAPGHRRVGTMLPTSPLHHLLLAGVGCPLVMTSGNRSDEPIAVDDTDARHRLDGIGDAFLGHDRSIVMRYDDSVTAIRRGVPAVLRRARGYAPTPVTLPVPVRPTLGTGAELQVAFCLAAGTDAFVSPHVGDLDDDETLAAYRMSLEHHRRLLGIQPELVAHDLHPDLMSTRLAETLGLPLVPVQHHHAHIAAVMAEHGVTGQVVGIALDGFGLGDDGTGWGGEILLCDHATSARAAHLHQVPQPGGDAAVRWPARMALAHAAAAGCLDEALELLDLVDSEPAPMLGGASASLVVRQAGSGLASPLTTSAGRLLDAVAALAGVCREATHEGQPAVLLEQVARPGADAGPAYEVELGERDGKLVIDQRAPFAAAVRDLLSGAPAWAVANRFHEWLASAVVEAAAAVAHRHGVRTVCLGGGVWANDLLLDRVCGSLERRGFEVLVPRSVPPGDGGLALGQVLVAGARGAG
jgi:hydrogenase maturation protein HypF